MLYEHLADELAHLIANGPLGPGDRLPSIRRLSEQKQLSISTVLQALHQLEDRGLVEAKPKAGFFVGRPAARLPEPRVASVGYQPTDVAVTQRLLAVLRANDAPDFATQRRIRAVGGIARPIRCQHPAPRRDSRWRHLYARRVVFRFRPLPQLFAYLLRPPLEPTDGSGHTAPRAASGEAAS